MDLPPASEEVAGFYGAMIETEHAQDKVFNKNFFNDFLKVLEKNPAVRMSLTKTMLVLNDRISRSEEWHQDQGVRIVRLPTDV